MSAMDNHAPGSPVEAGPEQQPTALDQLLSLHEEQVAGGIGECALVVLRAINEVENRLSTGMDVADIDEAKPDVILAGQLTIHDGYGEQYPSTEELTQVATISPVESLYAISHGAYGKKQQEIYYVNREDDEVHHGVHLWTLYEQAQVDQTGQPVSPEAAASTPTMVCSSSEFHPVANREHSVEYSATATKRSQDKPPSLLDDIEESGVTRKDILAELQDAIKGGEVTDAFAQMIRLPDIKKHYLPRSLSSEKVMFNIDNVRDPLSSRVAARLRWHDMLDAPWGAESRIERAGMPVPNKMLVAGIERGTDVINLGLTHNDLGSRGLTDSFASVKAGSELAAVEVDEGDARFVTEEIRDSLLISLGGEKIYPVDTAFIEGIQQKISEYENSVREQLGVSPESSEFLQELSNSIIEKCAEFRAENELQASHILDLGEINISRLGDGGLLTLSDDTDLRQKLGRIKLSVIANNRQSVFANMHGAATPYECSVRGAHNAFERCAGNGLTAIECRYAFINSGHLSDCIAQKCETAFGFVRGQTKAQYSGCVASECGSAFYDTGHVRYDTTTRYIDCIAADCGTAFSSEHVNVYVTPNEDIENRQHGWSNCTAVQCGPGSFIPVKSYRNDSDYNFSVSQAEQLVASDGNTVVRQRNAQQKTSLRRHKKEAASGYGAGFVADTVHDILTPDGWSFDLIDLVLPYPGTASAVALGGAYGWVKYKNRKNRRTNNSYTPVFPSA